jgi:elongation factor P
MAAVPSTNLRKGMAIRVNTDTGIILEMEHRTPGNLSGFIQVIMRSFKTGKSANLRFSSSERVEVIETDRQKLDFSYADQTGYFFMNPDTYETIGLPGELIEDSKDLLIENLTVEVLFIEGQPVTVELPPTVEMEVTEAPEGLKGDSASNTNKAITLSTGKVIQAPLFIKPGDRVVVDTRTSKYMGRA